MIAFHEAVFIINVLLKFLEWFLIDVARDKWTVGVHKVSQ
jgi:hypothetical protein